MPAVMRALSTLLQVLVLSGLAVACYTNEPTPLPQAAELGLVPLTPPDLARAEALYAEECAECHGASGRGDGWRVPELDGPRPRNFHDPRMVDSMSPARAYLAVTQGVPRTSMAAFALLSEPDRWHLAFYILSLGHSGEDAASGRDALAGLKLAQPTPRKLSELSNKNILDDLQARKLDEQARKNVLAYLRRDVPFAEIPSILSPARLEIVAAIADYRRGHHSRARERLQAAHLDHLKPALKVIRLRQSGLALAIELELDAVRTLLHSGAPLHTIEARTRTLFASLELAEPVLAQKLSAGVGIAQSATVALSYTIDGAIALFLLLVIGTRRGADRRERKTVGLGVLVGILMAVIIWLGWGKVENIFSGQLRTSFSLALSSLVALGSIPLLIATVRYFRSPPQIRIRAVPSWLLLLFVLASGVLVRDALEFVPALATIAAFSPAALLGFLGAGVAMICLVSLLVAMERRLGVAARTSLLCITITIGSVIAAGNALRSSQELGLLDAAAAGHLQSPWLAFWPTGQGVLAQLCVATICLLVLTVTTLLKIDNRAAT